MATLPSRSTKARAPKVGRPKGRFTQHRRVAHLRQVLEAKPHGLTLEELAASLKITQRSVRRYLGEFDDLEYVETRKGGPLRWRIKPGERGRAVSLRRAQAYALLATRPTFEVLRGSALYDEADLALAQIARVAQTPFRASDKTEISGAHNLESRFVFSPPPTKSYAARGEDLDELFRAVADLRVLRYRPRGRSGAARAERVAFHPYALVVYQGAIHVLGRHAERHGAEAEVILLESMSDIRTSETERFELPPKFDVEDYVHGDFGVATPASTRFIIDFDAHVSNEVRAKRMHPRQRLATSPDGRVRVELPLVDMRAAVAFVLSWGDAAHVIEPPELVTAVRDALSRAASRYE